MATTIKNKFGRITGWNQVSFTIHNRTMEGIIEIDYSDEVKHDHVYGAGGEPIGWEEGNSTYKASITVYSEELVALQKSIPKGTKIQSLRGTATSVYDYNGIIVIDRLSDVIIMNNGRQVKQGDGKIATKLDLLCLVDYDI